MSGSRRGSASARLACGAAGEGDIRDELAAAAQDVTAVEAPRHVAFAGPMGTSAARWGMELEPIDDRQTEAEMWIEVDLGGMMRAIPGHILQSRIQRVSDREMASIKAAVESDTPGGSEPWMDARADLP